MDIVDHAQRLAEQDLARALNENKAHFVGQDVDFIHCLECGIEKYPKRGVRPFTAVGTAWIVKNC